MGFLREGHPLALYRKVTPLKGANLKHCVGQKVAVVGWPITQKRVYTIRREVMSFTSFEDETALFEVILFPNVYTRYAHLIARNLPLLIEGRVVCDEGAISIEAFKFISI